MALTISTVEVLSLNTLLVVFSEPLSTLEANYAASSYTISGLTIRSVIPPTTGGAPVDLVLVTDKMVVGSAYELSAAGLEPASADTFDDTTTLDFTGQETKLDKVLSSTPILFDTSPDSTIRQVLTAIHRENGKIGGEGETVFNSVPTISQGPFVWSGTFPYPALSSAELVQYLGIDGSIS
jgi:hypothetical protein